MNETICPECGHDERSHGPFGCMGNAMNCKCEKIPLDFVSEPSAERADAQAAESLFESIERIRTAERDEARALARRMYRERNEIYRDLCAAENEIKRLRIAVMELWKIETGRDICYPSIDDGYGNSILAWCPICGGDMQVVRPGKFQCSECGI